MPYKDPLRYAAYHAAYMRRYMQDPGRKAAHHARVRQQNLKYRKQNRAWVQAYLAEHPCVDCGEAEVIVLDFDHVRGKKSDTISRMVTRPVTLKVLKHEVRKCEVRCANCHRRVTHRRRQQLRGLQVKKQVS